MSLRIVFENIFACPHPDCKYKTKKFDSIPALNMHYAKTHNKSVKITTIEEKGGTLRGILRRK